MLAGMQALGHMPAQAGPAFPCNPDCPFFTLR